MKHPRLFPFAAAALFLLTVGPAAADTVVTGTVGRAFSGDLEDGHTSYGAALGFMGDGILGFEIEGTYTPDFFGDTPGGDNNVTTLMGNILLGAPIGDSARIYATGGAGLMKFKVNDVDEFFNVDRNDFGINVGGGAIVYFGQNIGVRADLRYFRDVRESGDEFDVDLGGFHYWRGAFGLSFKF